MMVVLQVSMGRRRSEVGNGLTKGKSMPSLRLESLMPIYNGDHKCSCSCKGTPVTVKMDGAHLKGK